jgi:hypothetical protein
MNPLHFGAVNVNKVSQQGPFTHLHVTVTEDDREAFRPNLEYFEEPHKILAETQGDSWKFTLGVGPSKGGIRIVPGHASQDNEATFAAFGPNPVYGGPRENIKGIIEKALQGIPDGASAGISDAKENLKRWLA